MKTFRYLCAALFAALLAGCYEDKGNYDYKELNEPEVYLESYNAIIGQPLDIEPEYVFAPGKTADDYTFEWYVNTRKIGEGINLHVDDYQGDVGYRVSYLRITDKKLGAVFMNRFSITASTEYQTGFLVLADNGGNTELNFLRALYQLNSNNVVTGVDLKMYLNVAQDQDLPAEPLSVIEHHAGRTELGEIAVIGRHGGVELDGYAFKKVIDTESEFMNKQFPAELTQIDGALYLRYTSYIFGNGNLFARYNNTPDGYHTGSYMDIAVYPPNGGIDPGFTVSSLNMATYQGLIYDKLNHRYLLLADESVNYAGKIAVLSNYTNSAVPKDGTFDISNMGSNVRAICCSSYGTGYWTSMYYGFLRTDDGKTYAHEFAARNSYGSVRVNALTQYELSWGDLITDDTKLVTPYDEGDKAFIVTDDKIYVNYRGNSVPVLFASFGGAKVTAVDYDEYEYNGRWSYANKRMAVGLDDGRFFVFDISASAVGAVINGGEPTILYQTEGLGKIVSIDFKKGPRRDQF